MALDALLKANALGWGAYVAIGLRRPGLTRYRRGGNADVVALPALYVDLDDHTPDALARLTTFSPLPSCIVDSGGGYHAYWWLTEPITNFVQAGQCLQALRHMLQSDRVSIAQSLRLPGSVNTKPERHNALCHVITMSDKAYTLNDFAHLLPIRNLQSGNAQKPCITVQSLHTVHRKASARSGRTLNPDLIQAVSDRLRQEYAGYVKRNGYIAALCPCGHAHDRPGQHFNFDPLRGIGVCFGRHRRLLLREICQKLYMYPADYGGIFV